MTSDHVEQSRRVGRFRVTGDVFDVAVVGGGIVGLAAADALARDRYKVLVVEAEGAIGRHQTGHNSGVLHAGLYYPPGSRKATLCRAGRQSMLDFCAEQDIPHEVCGKLVVATEPHELPRLDALEARGRANGCVGLRRLGPEEIREREPAVAGLSALLVPETGIVDFGRVAAALLERARAHGAKLLTDARLLGVQPNAKGPRLQTTAGTYHAYRVLNCAGLQADRVARLCGADTDVTIVPFRGEYRRLRPHARDLVKHLVYPVPDPALPFLGVHFTRTITGDVEIGPDAVLAWSRHGYRRGDVHWPDLREMLGHRGVRRLLLKRWRTGLAELSRSRSHRLALAAMKRLIPELTVADIEPARSGVRAQAVGPDGALIDDFHLVEDPRHVHVLNAPSPAATASLAIGAHIAERVRS